MIMIMSIINKIIGIFKKPAVNNTRETGLGVFVLSLEKNTLQQVYGNHNLVERTPVYFKAQSNTTAFPKGLNQKEQYYIIKVTPTEFSVGLTPETSQVVPLVSQGSAYLFTGRNPNKL